MDDLAFLDPDYKPKKVVKKEHQKFAVGDWITGPTLVFLRVVAVLDDPKVSTRPLYAVRSIKDSLIKWYSDFEVEEIGLQKGEPNYKMFDNLRVGDIVATNLENGTDNNYRTVLARIEDTVLLSHAASAEAKQILDMEAFFEQHQGDLPIQMGLSDIKRKELKAVSSKTKSNMMAGEWYTVRELALLNWFLVSE